jgi:clan AA aspartic protease (TIGR02281 family)
MDAKREIIKNFNNEISKLHSSIKQLSAERQLKKDEYELILAERDILGTQLIRRNDESALLYEKIKIQQTTLAKGETAFRERLADLNLLDYKKGEPVNVGTANGMARGWRIRLNSVRLNDVEVREVDAVVTPTSMPFVLLGNSYLARFQMSRNSEQMVLEKRN